jgi:hypothetical protein
MSDEKQVLYPWQEGLPTKPDVDLLLKSWPDPKIGERFVYESVEALIGQTRDCSRFKTVTNKWRDRLRERGLVVECDVGKAFYVATTQQISAATYDVLRGVGRKAHKHRVKLSVSKPANDTERTLIEHQARLMNGIERDSKKARMNLLPPTAAPILPQVSPPKQRSET